ncbi:hypothetical protein WN944_025674 [Citrus x changshan-huyou]|uniref:non-specific serine/threonine protein kinase n=1 Tax=Citrus x changshan-huyou TaxID=2935761 RepID=A0AAP0LQ95_9ROSI
MGLWSDVHVSSVSVADSKNMLQPPDSIDESFTRASSVKHLPKHLNIVSLNDTYEDDSVVHIVMKLCEGGELFDRIVARGHYTERAAAAVMKTIVEVVQVCHKHGVMHRDLKPKKILFVNKKESFSLKAIDFGLSVFFRPREQFNEIVGSLYYMAPEVLKRNYGPEVDVLSETEQGVAQTIIHLVIDFKRDPWPKVFENAKDLVKKMLNPDPKQRLIAEESILGYKMPKRLQMFHWVVAEFLSVEEVAGLKEAFEMMDTNKRGKINLEELRLGLLKGGQNIPEADLQILMEAADVDGDGSLNYGEFVAVSVHLKKMANDEHLHKAFSFFDRNQSGFIEIEELQNALNDEVDTSSEDVINAIMHDVDTDKVSVQYMNSKVHVQ